MRYVAFLRGINVGGRRSLKVEEIRAVFEGLGFTDVRTVQASGNVVFGTGGEPEPAGLAARIEAGLRQALGQPIGVAVRRLADLEALVASEPFKGVPIGPETRLYVTFLLHPAGSETGFHPKTGSRRSRQTAASNLELVAVTGSQVLTAITLSPKWGTSELMAWLEKEFGPGVTTRNWNTLTKIVAG